MALSRLRWFSALIPLVVVLNLSLIAPVSANYDHCYASVGYYSTCYDSMTINDNLAYATNQMDDLFTPPNSSHIYFDDTSWYPVVSRGAPVFTTYWIVDNTNGNEIFLNDDYNGDYLNNYSNITIGTEVTANYTSSDPPSTAMEIRNSDPGTCSSHFWECFSYDQTSFFFEN